MQTIAVVVNRRSDGPSHTRYQTAVRIDRARDSSSERRNNENDLVGDLGFASSAGAFTRLGVDVRLVSTENLNLPATFLDIDVGSCTLGSTPTEQNQLFSNRNNAGTNDVVV